MSKIIIYFLPCISGDSTIFKHIALCPELYELHYLSWKKPLALEESISNYAMRMCEDIQHKNPVLIGVSFGGVLAQEMSRFIDLKKVIIISSVKNTNELPSKFNMLEFKKVYKIIPGRFKDIEKYFLSKFIKKHTSTFKELGFINKYNYLKWYLQNFSNWKRTEDMNPALIHIHGTKDKIFPLKNISNCISIEDGTHLMIFKKAEIITRHIRESLTF